MTNEYKERVRDTDIAVIGMSGRFPGAPNLKQFWANLRDGAESVVALSDDVIAECGVPLEVLSKPNYVKTASVLEDIDLFAAEYFGIHPREAEAMDPQHRLLLELAVESLEDAACDPLRFQGRIGLFAGVGISTYAHFFQAFQSPWRYSADTLAAILQGNDKDYAVTRAAYKLGLRGPCVTVQTACSTSLVAVHLACQSLISQESDVCLAGGVYVRVPQTVGYLYEPGSILSPDGHCRAFDKSGRGTIFGSGAGLVVLKQLHKALADGDRVDAVIRGSAMNNDGSDKIGYTAPSIRGQAEAIAEALSMAEAEAGTISYIEAHGTGTELGDSIELQALREAFSTVEEEGVCAIGSVKTNVGHLNTAAGIAGLIKTVLALKNRVIPASLNCLEPNGELDSSPFMVNCESRPWIANGNPRRAGVSSFGIGGTNVHLVVEEAPDSPQTVPSSAPQVLTLSAKTTTALQAATFNLLNHLEGRTDDYLADTAHTLQTGRTQHSYRRAVVAASIAEAREQLQILADAAPESVQEAGSPRIAFLYPGQGAQYAGMGSEIYRSEPVFRERIDTGCAVAGDLIGVDLRETIFARGAEADLQLMRTRVTQPALLILQLALTAQLQSWGIRPDYMIGHSLGEYAAACAAGVIGFEDVVALVCERGRLMDELPGGVMLAVSLSEAEAGKYLSDKISLAAVNAGHSCVLSGAESAISRVEELLGQSGTASRRLHSSHAFHSPMMEPMLPAFDRFVRGISLRSPKIPYISNLTGNWITKQSCTRPEYWTAQIRGTVRFLDGVNKIVEQPEVHCLEVGPGRTLCGLVRQIEKRAKVIPAMQNEKPEAAMLRQAVSALWQFGAQVEWSGLHEQPRRRVELPGYAFERRSYWPKLQPSQSSFEGSPIAAGTLYPRPDISEDYVAPRTVIEKKIAGIWCEVLGMEKVGVNDNFFDLGGHSLLATQIVTRLDTIYQVDVPLQRIFESPTIETLAQLIEESLMSKMEGMSDEEVSQLLASMPETKETV